jgi:protein-S-isoprenylcysteine O-methyltransferase Ste14
MRVKLNNIPIPETHVAGIVLGLLLTQIWPMDLIPNSLIKHLIGWPMLILGAGICWWAVWEAGQLNIDTPDRLLTTGPYAYSRNPMYVGWTMMYLGLLFLLNSIWLLIFLPVVLAHTHFYSVLREEQYLMQEFGEQFKVYCSSVRRYL